MNMISKFIRQWKAFRLSLRLLKLIDPKKLEDLIGIIVIISHFLYTTMSIDIMEGFAHGMNVRAFNECLYLRPDTWIDFLQDDVKIFKFLWVN